MVFAIANDIVLVDEAKEGMQLSTRYEETP